jgi:hypothetical protein
VTLCAAGFFVLIALVLYGAWVLASWEHRLITDWLDGDRSTPPPTSAFFPESIARQWWADYEKRK